MGIAQRLARGWDKNALLPEISCLAGSGAFGGEIVAGDASERILGLAAYLERAKATAITLADIARDVPGYETDGELIAGTKEWETVRKRLQRDLQTLEASFGIVVDFDDEDHAYRLRGPYFSPAERRALIGAAAAVEIDGMDDEPLLGELGAAVDEKGQRIVLSVPGRVRELSDAIRKRSSVRFMYHGRKRTLDAYVIGRWRTHWYVAGFEHECGARRRYRLDRIESHGAVPSVEAVGDVGSYDIPADIDPIAEMRLDPNDWGYDPPVIAAVRVGQDHVHTFQHELGGRVISRDAEAFVIELEVRHYASFCDRLLAFSTHVRLLEPPELVTTFTDRLRAVAATSDVR